VNGSQLALLAVLAVPPGGDGGRPARPAATVTRTETPPRVDGRLDDPVWQRATPIGELVQVDPVEGAPPSEATEIRFLYDADQLYMAVRCFDREPEEILVTTRERDAFLDDDDRVEIVFDTFHDGRNAFFFQINAGGSKGDALVTNNGANFNKPWDGLWEGHATIDAEGWTAELALPFKTLNFREGERTWGFNVERRIGRKREEARWSNASRDYNLFNIFHAGELSGFEGIRQGIGLDVVPFFVSHWQNDRAGEDKNLLGEPGFDLFYKLIPSLTFSLTVNTDFAETEVDSRQVDLSRFDLFFPERRDFFLQDAGLFEFGLNFAGGSGLGGGDRALIPFFSRRIGLSSDGEEIPILAGAKLTGRAGAYGIGVLDVQTEETAELDSQNLFAARLTRNLGEQSTIGAIATHGDPEGEVDNSVYGVDAAYRTSEWNGGQSLVSTVFFLRSEGEDQSGGQSSFGFSLRAPNDRLSWDLGLLEIQQGFRPELGFVPRRDVRRYRGSLSWTPRPDWDGVRQLEFGVGSVLFSDDTPDPGDFGGASETWETELELFGIELESGDQLELGLTSSRDELTDPFLIHDDDQDGVEDPGDVRIDAGRYDFVRPQVGLETGTQRELALGLGASTGDFFDGELLAYEASLIWRPGPLFNGTLAYEHNDVSLQDGDFVTQLASLRANVSFSPELSWNNFIQWSTDEDTFGFQSRLRWIPVPHQEVFLVLNQEQESDSSSSAPVSQELSFKITYALRF
jgi:hypothetical protein